MASSPAISSGLAVHPAGERVQRSAADARHFALLALPLALLLVLFKEFGLEQPAFFTLSCLAFGGFAVAYWLPFRMRETFTILLSLGSAYVLMTPFGASLLLVAGFAIFGILRTRLSFALKLCAMLAVFVGFAYGRAFGPSGIPLEFWGIFGSIFVFRMIVYLYDMKHASGPPLLKDYLSYFFLLPNYYFLLFPVVDFQTLRKSYYRRDINAVAQQGVWWIFLGTTHLLLYRLIYQSQSAVTPDKMPIAAAVLAKAILSYLMLLRVTGQFHIVIGMLHLFGYDLPANSRYFLFANGFGDMWRRVSIYWKDFMVKIAYFPTYFRMRRSGEVRAQLVGTAIVFVVTWFLHALQFFLLQGRIHIAMNDSLFWTILGLLVMANVWMDSRRRRKRTQTGWAPAVRRYAQIAATLITMSLLWSMWSANSMPEWFYFLKSGRILE